MFIAGPFTLFLIAVLTPAIISAIVIFGSELLYDYNRNPQNKELSRWSENGEPIDSSSWT